MSALVHRTNSSKEVIASKIASPGPKSALVAKIIKKSYVLNELEAMRKKLNYQYRNPIISVEGEAKNGSTINVNVKTSLFEYTKAKLIEALKDDPQVIETNQTVTATALSKHSGTAEVEYQMECVYKANEVKHKVKITCYTTTCKITVTNMGEESVIKSHLGNKYNARYFVESFLEPFLKKAEVDFPNLDEKFVPLILKEIERLESIEKQPKGPRELPSSNTVANGVTKCVFKSCKKGKSENLILANKAAYGTCNICHGHEHFTCSNTKDWRKIDIINGTAKYHCTNCYAEHHTSLTLQNMVSNASTEINAEIPMLEYAYVVEAIVHNSETLLSENENSNYTISSLDELSSEKINCDMCDKTFSTNDQLKEHEETHKCNICSVKFATEEKLKEHQQEKHEIHVKCDECSATFPTQMLINHKQEEHKATYKCVHCSELFDKEDIMKIHINEQHQQKYKCDICDQEFCTVHLLNDHKSEKHVKFFKCDLCEYEGETNLVLEVHKSDTHVIVACSFCDTFLDTRILLQEHINKEHATVDLARVTSDKEYIEQIVKENEDLKSQLRSVKDDFERLSSIYRKEQEDFKELKLNIDIDLTKTRDEYRRLKADNEKLIVRNDTLYKLGNIALEHNKSKSDVKINNKQQEDIIEVIEEETIEIEELETLAKNKNKGFRRTSPTSSPNTEVKDRLYSQATSTSAGPSPEQKERVQAQQQQHNQEEVQQQQPQDRVHRSQDRKQLNSVRYCHSFNNGTCTFEERTGRKCTFVHGKAPACNFDGFCTRKKCMYSHPKEEASFLGQQQFYTTNNNPMQMFMEQLMGTVLQGHHQGQMWGQQAGQRRNFF